MSARNLLVCVLLITALAAEVRAIKWYCLAAAPVVGAAAVVGTGAAVGAVGFGAAGIAAGSWAASMMSAGLPVATLQSIGAVGAGATTFASASAAWAYYCK